MAKQKIKLDSKNYRKHSDRNKELINLSLSELGAGRSILLDADNVVVAGNGVYEQAEKLKIPIRIIETTGDELIAVKRTDLKPDDAKRKELALADNAVSDTSDWDDLSSWNTETLEKWDIVLPELESEEVKSNAKLSDKFLVPPFSVLDTRQGYWQERKRWWLQLGIKSELGRGDCLSLAAAVRFQQGAKALPKPQVINE